MQHALLWATAAAALTVAACSAPDETEERSLREVESLQLVHDLSHKINTNLSGANYIQQCKNAGVPVPREVTNSTGWINHGEVTNEFLDPDEQAELWSYEDPTVDGVCAALPRWDDGGIVSTLFGVICLGRKTSTTCFWDNPNGVGFLRSVPTPIDSFVGGWALDANGQGKCSDCHAGENPFVVHPAQPAFQDFVTKRSITPDDWPKPIVPAAFPGNPGPIDQLGPVPQGEVPCDGCHGVGSGKRFPVPSTSLGGYCSVVLGSATSGGTKTMPFGGGNGATHANWLLSQCKAPPPQGTVVEVPSFTPSMLSPPLLGPVYACTKKVKVSGLVYGATVQLEVDSAPVAVPAAAAGSTMEVTVDSALAIGQVVTAKQSLGALASTQAEAEVEDHKLAYPNGLPAPVVLPAPLFTCARSIAVLNVPGGVELIATKKHNAAPVATYTTETAVTHTWMGLWTEPSFVPGDAFTVKQRICQDTSPASAEVAVVSAPTTFQAPAFVPPLVAGQQVADIGSLVQGGRLKLLSGSSVEIDLLSQPYTYFAGLDLAGPLGGPVTASQQLSLEQSLCNKSKRTELTVAACDPDALLAQVATPVEGDTFVIVTQAPPGATLHVVDASDVQIGGASGATIQLIRPLVGGEKITIIASLPGCTAGVGFQIQVFDLP